MPTNIPGAGSMPARRFAHRRRRTAGALGALLCLHFATACKGVLDVDLPGRVQEAALDDPSLAGLMITSTVADFECAYAEYVSSTALWANEFIPATGFVEGNNWGTRLSTAEGGTATCATAVATRGNYSVYLPMQIARGQAENALRRMDGFADDEVTNKNLLLATAAAYSGYAHTLLGEAFCAVVLDGETRVPPATAFGAAEARFTRAIDLATAVNDTRILNMARIGRARVRLALGKKAEAAADARLVPAAFVFNATYASTAPRRINTLVLNHNTNMIVSVDPKYRNLTIDGVADPRVPVRNMNRKGNDAFTDLWAQTKYTGTDSPIPIATWEEAQLVIAEAEGGQSAIDAINRLRTKYALPQYRGGTEAQIMAQIIEERRRQFFLDGHSIGDHLRYNLPFETGVNHKGARYAENRCIPLPSIEVGAT